MCVQKEKEQEEEGEKKVIILRVSNHRHHRRFFNDFLYQRVWCVREQSLKPQILRELVRELRVERCLEDSFFDAFGASKYDRSGPFDWDLIARRFFFFFFIFLL